MEDDDNIALPPGSPPPPPRDTRNGIIMSGFGNGIMIGAAPLAVSELYNEIVHNKPLPPKHKIALGVVALVSSGIGAYYGIKEADRVESYRAQLYKNLQHTEAKLDAMEQKLDRWGKKIHAQKAAGAASADAEPSL